VLLRVQINVWVGAFFVISGYVVGYTATELNKYEASSRIRDVVAYIVGRVSTFYPLYLLVQVLAGAMFVYADYTYNGLIPTIAHGVMSLSLIQVCSTSREQLWYATANRIDVSCIENAALAVVLLPATGAAAAAATI
jgi:peptidoglycan/LPS O-acetylase OafA/YrhL